MYDLYGTDFALNVEEASTVIINECNINGLYGSNA